MHINQKKEIEEIVDVVINKLKRESMMKETTEVAYSKISERLFNFYKTKKDNQLETILNDLQEDNYIRIIPLYYQEKYTIETIAETLQVDTSTIVRNKKRLCLTIAAMLE